LFRQCFSLRFFFTSTLIIPIAASRVCPPFIPSFAASGVDKSQKLAFGGAIAHTMQR
jgi:hypothetical protein